jgi:hypothetical protein
MLARMSLNKKIFVALAVLALAAAGYWAYGAQQKKAQQQAISALVGDATAQLREALASGASGEQVAKVEEGVRKLQSMNISRQKPLASAADVYLVSVRAIMARSSDFARRSQQAAASRKALAAHIVSPRGRTDAWIRRAAELKKAADQAHRELALQADTLADLLRSLPSARQPLELLVERSLLLEDSLLDAATKRIQAQSKQAADALAEQVRPR